MTLEFEVKQLMDKGIYDPHQLYNILYNKYSIHYSKVREAIHNAKQK